MGKSLNWRISQRFFIYTNQCVESPRRGASELRFSHGRRRRDDFVHDARRPIVMDKFRFALLLSRFAVPCGMAFE
jgi:hypothetical protein